MTAEEIDRLTIGEVRAIVDRAHEALGRLREVQALLGGAREVTRPPSSLTIHTSRESRGAPSSPTPEQQDYLDNNPERARLLALNRAEVIEGLENS